MLQKTRKLKTGDGITIDSLGVIYCQTESGLIAVGTDDYSALHESSGWYVPEYYVLPGVVEIGECAFIDCNLVQKFYLEDGLKSIKGSAFYGCKALKEIVIPYSVSYVAPDAFMRCTSLQKISLPLNIDFDSPLGDGPMVDGLPENFLEQSLDSLKEILIPGEKRAILEEKLPHLKHLFVDK